MTNNKDKFVVDTVAFLRYLSGTIPDQVNDIFLAAEDEKVDLIIPSTVIGELIYTIEKGKKISGRSISKENTESILSTIFSTSNFLVKDLGPTGWKILMQSKIPELHDRMIVATCLQERAKALLTSDREIMLANEIVTIWND